MWSFSMICLLLCLWYMYISTDVFSVGTLRQEKEGLKVTRLGWRFSLSVTTMITVFLARNHIVGVILSAASDWHGSSFFAEMDGQEHFLCSVIGGHRARGPNL